MIRSKAVKTIGSLTHLMKLIIETSNNKINSKTTKSALFILQTNNTDHKIGIALIASVCVRIYYTNKAFDMCR